MVEDVLIPTIANMKNILEIQVVGKIINDPVVKISSQNISYIFIRIKSNVYNTNQVLTIKYFDESNTGKCEEIHRQYRKNNVIYVKGIPHSECWLNKKNDTYNSAISITPIEIIKLADSSINYGSDIPELILK